MEVGVSIVCKDLGDIVYIDLELTAYSINDYFYMGIPLDSEILLDFYYFLKKKVYLKKQSFQRLKPIKIIVW